MASPVISVITAVKDAPEALATTLASVAEQRLVDVAAVEHLIIDGSEEPGPVNQALSAHPDARLVRRPARGIYPAMNDGLHEARGQYAYFLNAGDTLFSPVTLQTVLDRLMPAQPLWAYGEVEILERDGRRTITPRWDYAREKSVLFSRGLFPPHQGTFAQRASLLECGGFDEEYRIAADYAMALCLSLRSDPAYLDLVVATFPEGGASTQGWRASLAEFHRARRTILHPTGWTSVREYAETASRYAAMTAYREVWSKVRRP